MSIEYESNSAKVGRFEAMQGARNAFTGHARERVNTRSQQLAAEKNNNQQVQAFTPEQFKTKNEVIGTQDKINSKEVQSAWNTYGLAEQGLLKSEQAWQLNMQLPFAIEQKLGKAGKEQVLFAIQARKAQAEKAVNAETTAQEHALTQQEIQLEADKLLAMAPESLLAGSLAALAIWAINRLPNKVYKATAIGAILTLILAACTTINRTPTVEVPTFTGPTSTEVTTATPEGTTAAIIGTATAETAKTQEASRADAFVEAVLAGKSVDVSQLSPSEFKEFSTKLAEKKNTERGINPVLYKQEAYINPENYMMMNYDGHADQEETIEMYLAIAGKDAEGNIQIIDENGKIITIANSAGVDWNMVVTDPNDPRIDLGNTGPKLEDYNNLTGLQVNLSKGSTQISPMVLLDKNPGLIYFEGNEGGLVPFPTYHFLRIETDQNGNPILARKFLVFPAMGTFYGCEEGSKERIEFNTVMSDDIANSSFQSNLDTNHVYYLQIRKEQNRLFEENIFSSPNGYTGVISGDESVTTLDNQLKDDSGMIVLGSDVFIEKN